MPGRSVPALRRGRQLVATTLAIILLIGIGLLTLSSQQRSDAAAAKVHRADRLELQSTLTSLAHQYLSIAFSQLQTVAQSPGWAMHPGSPVDAARLRALTASPLGVSYAALLTTPAGKPLATVGGAVPPPTDPGYRPLWMALKAGQPGLSAVMAYAGRQLVAFAVPILRGGRPVGTLIGYADATSWPMQRYVSQMQVGPKAQPFVLDGSGVVAAGPTTGYVGRPLAGLPATPPTSAAEFVRFHGRQTTYVATRGDLGFGGWQLLTRQPATVFAGSAGRHRMIATFALLTALLVAILAITLANQARNRALRKVAESALFDPLTRLAQRRLLHLRMHSALARQRRTGEPIAVLYADLDGFKAVNDAHGHRRGDALLAAVAVRLRGCVRDDDFIARPGGDEFVILVEGVSSIEEIRAVAQRITDVVVEPVTLDRGVVHVGISIGVVVADGGTPDGLLEAADTAMYEAKRTGGPVILDLTTVAWPTAPEPAAEQQPTAPDSVSGARLS